MDSDETRRLIFREGADEGEGGGDGADEPF